MELENISLMFVYGAMAAYTVAMVAFAIDFSKVTVAKKAGSIAMSVTVLAVALHFVGTLTRAIAASRVPWANMYEYTLSFTLVAMAVFLWYSRKHDVRAVGAFLVPVVLLSLGIATSVLYVKVQGTPPILDNYWLVIHVSTAIIATGLFGFSAILSVLQLVSERQHAKQLTSTGSDVIEEDRSRSLPSPGSLEQNAFSVTVIGFILWSFTLIAGAIWAEHSWGRPWGWDPKETGSLIVWFVYAAYLHTRATRGWEGRRAAYLCLAGFAAVMANYYLVNLFADSLHSYSGV